MDIVYSAYEKEHATTRNLESVFFCYLKLKFSLTIHFFPFHFEAYKTQVSRNSNMAKLQAGYLFPEVRNSI